MSHSRPPIDEIECFLNDTDSKDIILTGTYSTKEVAEQITLIDALLFSKIKAYEFEKCAWSKIDKNVRAPNIMAYLNQFNKLTTWIVQTILVENELKTRIYILNKFIDLIHKLYQLNNLNSMQAVLSALQTASIFRLSKTWAGVSKKNSDYFTKYKDMFSFESNFRSLRNYLDNATLPCVPYIGPYLSDITVIQAMLDSDLSDSTASPNNYSSQFRDVVTKILNFQTSNYSFVKKDESLKSFFEGLCYQDMKNSKDSQYYQKSLNLEPNLDRTLSTPTKPHKNLPKKPDMVPMLDASFSFNPSFNSAKKKGHSKYNSIGNKSDLKQSCLRVIHNVLSPFSNESKNDEKVGGVSETTHSKVEISEFSGRGSVKNDSYKNVVQCVTPVAESSCILLNGYLKRKKVFYNGKNVNSSSYKKYYVSLKMDGQLIHHNKKNKAIKSIDLIKMKCDIDTEVNSFLIVIDKTSKYRYKALDGIVAKSNSKIIMDKWVGCILEIINRRSTKSVY